MRSAAHGPGGRWASGRFPKNPLWVRLAKNRLTSSKNQPKSDDFSDLAKKFSISSTQKNSGQRARAPQLAQWHPLQTAATANSHSLCPLRPLHPLHPLQSAAECCRVLQARIATAESAGVAPAAGDAGRCKPLHHCEQPLQAPRSLKALAAKAPVRRSPGLPGLPGLPPHRSRLTFSHIPTDRCAAQRTGPGADGPAVDFRKTHFRCVWLKIDSRAAKINPKVMTFRTWPKSVFRGRGKSARGVGAEIQKGAPRDHGGSGG
jgi:hypothetical protein